MILIITHKDDFTADFVIEKLNKRGLEYYRFNCEDIDTKGYSFKLGEVDKIQINGLSKIDSVWFRRTKLPILTTENYGENLFLLNDYDSLLSNIYHLVSPQKWMSHPKYVYEAENKLYQLKTASTLGLKIPDTIVSNQKKEVKKFITNHNHKVIIKPLSQGRITEKNKITNIFTNIMSKEVISNIDKYDLTPAIIQPYIEKEYEIRTTIVNGKIFSVKIESQINEMTKIDWRKEKIKTIPYDLPKDINKKLIHLLKRLGLNFGAIDIIKTPSGEYYFLEINPNGQWAWIEFDTGFPIADEIINFLK